MTERVVVVEVNGAEHRFRLDQETVRIGRSPDCDIVLGDEEVSREHAVLVWKGERWDLRDWWAAVRRGRPETASRTPEQLFQTDRHAIRLAVGIERVTLPDGTPG